MPNIEASAVHTETVALTQTMFFCVFMTEGKYILKTKSLNRSVWGIFPNQLRTVYIIHSANLYFSFGPLRSVRIFRVLKIERLESSS